MPDRTRQTALLTRERLGLPLLLVLVVTLLLAGLAVAAGRPKRALASALTVVLLTLAWRGLCLAARGGATVWLREQLEPEW